MRAAMIITAVLATACSSILGIGDLPSPSEVSDAPVDTTPDAPACPGTMQRCGATCEDLTTAADHCGACDVSCPTVTGGARSCVASLCRLDVDESLHQVWTLAAPGPYLAFWKDGQLLASSAGGNSTKLLSTGATPTAQAFTALAGRPTIVIPSNPAKPSVAITHYGFFEGRTEADAQLWNNGIHGCCGSSGDGFAVDPILDRMFAGHGITEIETDMGQTTSATPEESQHGSPFYVTATSLYLPLRGTPKVDRFDRSHNLQWSLPMSATAGVLIGDGAIASDGGLIIASSVGDKMTRFLPTGAKAWEIPVTAPGSPITTSSGLVIVGATRNAMPQLCAFDLATGAERWCSQMTAAVVDALAANDGVIYTTLASEPAVLGIDAATGLVRYHFRNVQAPNEMVLRDGRLYLSGGGAVTAIDVPATRYDASSWPVRFHDNQRTRGTQATLEF